MMASVVPAELQGDREGAVQLCELSARHGYNADAALQLGRDLGLECAEESNADGALAQWLRGHLGDGTLSESPPVAVEADPQLVFRQMLEPESSTYTYLLGDSATKEAILIDPVVETIDRDLAMAQSLGLTLTHGINTHCHADHITGTGELKRRLPALKSAIAKASGAKADVLLEGGDTVQFGKFALTVVPTPGHTDGCLTFVLGKIAFTGDAVLIRGCGRTDFQQGSPGNLYDNVHAKVFTLSDDTAIYPAHDYKKRNVSTVGDERNHNARLTKTRGEFEGIMDNLGLSYPKKIDVAVPANMACGLQD